MQFAIAVALKLSQTDVPSPLRVAMDGEGGLTFEWRDDQSFTALEITGDKHVEYCKYEDCRLVDKLRLT